MDSDSPSSTESLANLNKRIGGSIENSRNINSIIALFRYTCIVRSCLQQLRECVAVKMTKWLMYCRSLWRVGTTKTWSEKSHYHNQKTEGDCPGSIMMNWLKKAPVWAANTFTFIIAFLLSHQVYTTLYTTTFLFSLLLITLSTCIRTSIWKCANEQIRHSC